MSNSKKNVKGRLFNNEKFLFVFSLVLSFVIWIAVAANSGESVYYTVTDIPVELELSEDAVADGLTVVSVDNVPIQDYSVSVKVTGNSVTVGSLTPSDIQVYGSNLGNIVTSGTYNVTLAARPVGVKSNYSITSVTPNEVTVVVDRNIEKSFDIESQIVASSPADYYMGSPTFSSKSVSIKGPEQSVSKVSKVVVNATVQEEITQTTTLKKQKIILLDTDGNAITDDSLIVEPAEVDVTIPVLTKKTVPIVVDYENKPKGLAIEHFVTVEPSEIEIAASKDIIDSIDSISVGTLDFSSLYPDTRYSDFEVVMPEGVRNLNNIEKARVNFNYDDMATVEKQITSFQFMNVPEGLSAQYSSYSSIQVRVIGPEAELNELKDSDISAVIDLTDANMGTFDMPVKVRISGITSCWIYGTYSVNVTVSDEINSSLVNSKNFALASDNDANSNE